MAVNPAEIRKALIYAADRALNFRTTVSTRPQKPHRSYRDIRAEADEENSIQAIIDAWRTVSKNDG